MRTLKTDKQEVVREFKPVLLYTDDEQVQINIDENSLLRHQLSDSEIDLFLSATTPVDTAIEEVKNESKLAPKKPNFTKSSSPSRQGPQRCQVCGKVFANASALAKHKLTHSDERRYICTMCAKAFKRQDHLNGHMLTHRNKKPYECKAEGCSKSYCDARSLRRHTENHHGGSSTTAAANAEPSLTTCIQYAPPPKDQKHNRATEKLGKQQLDLIQQVIQKNHHQPATKSFGTTKAFAPAVPSTSGTKSWTMQEQNTHVVRTMFISGQFITESKCLTSSEQVINVLLKKGTLSSLDVNRKPHQPPALKLTKKGQLSIIHSEESVAQLPGFCFQSITDTNNRWGKAVTLQTSQPTTKPVGMPLKPVECNLCHRKFKNIPALNGHMRLHGGYFKKDSEARRNEIKDVNSTPLHTASVSVRALIEEKIILKRISKPSGTIHVEQGPFAVQSGDTTAIGHNLGMVRKSVPVDIPMMKKVSKNSAKRTITDPGIMKIKDSTLLMNAENGLLSYQELADVADDTQSLQNELNDPVILESVDSSSIGGVSTKLDDIDDIAALDDCHSVGESLPSPQSFQHNQDIQNVLDSPLPASLADFAYAHSHDPDNDLQNDTKIYSSSIESRFDYSPPKLSSHQSSSDNPTYFSPDVISSTSISGEPIMPSKSPSPSTSILNASFQSQMMPNSEDPLLSSSPKEFISRKRVDYNPLKVLHKNTSAFARDHTTQNVAGILLGSNGELRVIHTSPKPASKYSSSINSYSSGKLENSIKIRSISLQPKATFMKKYEKHGQFFSDESKDKADDALFTAPSLALSPLYLYRKRPRMDLVPHVSQYKSRLRNFKTTNVNKSLTYTPPPMLPPSRPGKGLFWLAITSTPSSTTLNKGSSLEELPEAPKSDSKPHMNIGLEFQAEIPDYECEKINTKDKSKDHLLWDSNLNKIVSDYEVEKYLEFACCAAVPGGGRNKEHALHLLHMCNGVIQDAILKLMQPVSWLPVDHPLLTFEYADSEKWNMTEIDIFYQALLKYDKDFTSVAREIDTKTSKQCIQFYYLWKKVCSEEYKKLRVFRKRFREAEYENESPKIDQQTGDAELVSTTSSEGRLFLCEFQDCSASFNSRAALNGHIRIHVGGTTARCGTPDKRCQQATESLEEYPCKICGKVFNKVKSRSAHMKSHRSPDDMRKQKSEFNKDPNMVSLNRAGAVSSSISLQRTN